MRRNIEVEKAATAAIDRIDYFIGGGKLQLPAAANRKSCDGQIAHRSGSVRLASLFLAFYSAEDPRWRCDSVPTGARGQYGDKMLAEQLTERHITLHDAITAFGENLGWKGNVVNVRLSNDPRFSVFCEVLKKATQDQRKRIADYLAAKFAESRREVMPLPPVGDDVLTFARAKELFERLLALSTEGHVQQFLVAAMLTIHRGRYGLEIKTHHPHASDKSDKYDETAGDIEEFHNGSLLRAYEVTVRPDWKNRVSNFRAKMDKHSLPKYVIIAQNVNSDEELAVPAKLITFLKPIHRDIAVVDIHDVAMVMAAELTALELRRVVNVGYDLLCQRNTCGRADFQDAYRRVVDTWLDENY